MKKYIITTVNIGTGTIQHLNRTDKELDITIEKELGGWDNLNHVAISACSTTNYQQCGCTKNGLIMFSILHYYSLE